jgi:SAM-dependent methyltransferase
VDALLSRDQRDWTDLGLVDPFWAVWSISAFRFGGGDVDEFFRSGEREVDAILAGLRENLDLPARHDRALDFGCGVGRLTRPLAGHFGEVIGVDISPSMIDAAQALQPVPANCSFVLNSEPDLRRFPSGHFDLVCSVITLQHVSRAAGIERYIAEFVRVTAPGGVAVFQLPARVSWLVRAHPRRAVYHALRAVGVPAARLYRRGLYAMALTAVPSRRVKHVVERSGGRVLLAFPDDHCGSRAIESIAYCVSSVSV